MDETAKFQLPYVQAAQAQKHVTVNDGLTRIDSMVQLALLSLSLTLPPVDAVEGDTYGLPTGAVNDWAGHDGEIAVFANGGWIFQIPQTGWQAWLSGTSQRLTYTGNDWQPGVLGLSPKGALSRFSVVEFDHVLGAGPTSTTSVDLPANSLVFGVSGVVVVAVTGTLSDWRLGIAGSDAQFGNGLGTAQGSYVLGMLGQPTAHYSATPLLCTGNGGDFVGGTLRLCLHYYQMTYPQVGSAPAECRIVR